VAQLEAAQLVAAPQDQAAALQDQVAALRTAPAVG